MRPMVIGIVGAAIAASALALGCGHDNDNRGAAQPTNAPAMTNTQPVNQRAVYGTPSPADNTGGANTAATATPASPDVNDVTPGQSAGTDDKSGTMNKDKSNGAVDGTTNSPTNVQPVDPSTPGNTTPGNASPKNRGSSDTGASPGTGNGSSGNTAGDGGITPIYGTDGGTL